MIKPVDYKQFVDVIKTIDLYWSLSELPWFKGVIIWILWRFFL
jgi:hypothetical protein